MLQVRNCKILLLAALLVGVAGTAFSGTPCGTNLEYEIVGTTLVLTSPNPTQPATVANSAFKENTTITSFTLPDNVWQIGSQAFFRCTSLADVDLSNVQDISGYAFDSCFALTHVLIPPTVTNIGVHAFYRCEGLSSVYCRSQIAPDLGADAFTHCDASLQICVPALGGDPGYGSKPNWVTYKSDGILSLCFLDENDDFNLTRDKITMFRDYFPRTEVDIFRTLRKAGCFNTLTLPFNVPDIAASPLVGAEVCEFVGAMVLDGALQLDITPVTSNSLIAGTPYLIQWANTGEVLERMHFTGITWDDDQTADDAGTGEVSFHGFYGKTHINDNKDGENHFNLFLGGNNTLYWPTDGGNASAKMLGFRAWFQIIPAAVSPLPIYKGMPATLHIVNTPGQTTEVETITNDQIPMTNKVVKDGQIIIIKNGEKFSITGQRL